MQESILFRHTVQKQVYLTAVYLKINLWHNNSKEVVVAEPDGHFSPPKMQTSAET